MTNNVNNNNPVAQIILEQLGGFRFIAMTGAKNLGATSNSLRFNISSRNKAKANGVEITLNASDTYTVHFYSINKRDWTVDTKKQVSGVYADMLQDLFTEVTGLYTKL